MSGNRKITVIVLVVVVAALALVVLSRGWIAKRIYFSNSRRLVERLSPNLAEKYSEELTYSLEKFWSVHERGLTTQNDMNDVMDRMKRLLKKETLEDEDIFNFGGFVSRIYTDAIQQHQRETSEQQQIRETSEP